MLKTALQQIILIFEKKVFVITVLRKEEWKWEKDTTIWGADDIILLYHIPNYCIMYVCNKLSNFSLLGIWM